jgi:hypothetical protein
MAFVGDPKSPGVIDPEKRYALWTYVRDVPKDEEWFNFLFEDREFIATAKYSWAADGQTITYAFRITQLENALRFSPSRRKSRYEPTPQEFRSDVCQRCLTRLLRRCGARFLANRV